MHSPKKEISMLFWIIRYIFEILSGEKEIFKRDYRRNNSENVNNNFL
jgi:hypothetical protein